MKPNQPKTWKLGILLLVTQYDKSISRGPLGVALGWSSMSSHHVVGKALATHENTSAAKLSLLQGYFACQLNKSEQFLKIFRLSRLCDQVELVLYLYDLSKQGDELNFILLSEAGLLQGERWTRRGSEVCCQSRPVQWFGFRFVSLGTCSCRLVVKW